MIKVRWTGHDFHPDYCAWCGRRWLVMRYTWAGGQDGVWACWRHRKIARRTGPVNRV